MDNKVDLPAFEEAQRRSERGRILCMMGAIGFVLLVGVYRIISPIKNASATPGLIITVFGLCYLVFEAFFFMAQGKALAKKKDLSGPAVWFHTVIESLYTVLIMAALVVWLSSLPVQERVLDIYTLLVSPGYGFILVVMALSPLRLDTRLAVQAGAAGTIGYGLLLAYALTISDTASPHPIPMYFFLAIVLVVATILSAVVTHRVREYVTLAVREVETRRLNEKMQRDLETARAIQRNLLPEDEPDAPGYDLAAICRPAEQTGGDYYDWLRIGDRLIITLGDVTGHGVGPAMVTAACRAYVRSALEGGRPIEEVFATVNAQLHSDIPEGRFVTFAMLELDLNEHRASLLSAGHGPSFRLHQEGEAEFLDAQGMPFGLVDEQEMEPAFVFDFMPGDVFVLLSDGFFEWANAERESFGTDRLRQVLFRQRSADAQSILDGLDKSIQDHVGDVPQDDDMTAVVIRRIP